MIKDFKDRKITYLNILKCVGYKDFSANLQTNFYLCECSIDKKKLICEECINKCHSDCYQKFIFNHSYNYQHKCICEKDKHERHSTTNNVYELYNSKFDHNSREGCFYENYLSFANESENSNSDTNFIEFTENRLEYFQYENRIGINHLNHDIILCGICSDNCLKDPDKLLKKVRVYPYKIDKTKRKLCNCLIHCSEEFHREIVYKNINFKKYFSNFDLNFIFRKFPKYIDDFKTLLSSIPSNKDKLFEDETMKEFIELYSQFNEHYNNKFFAFVNFFDKDKYEGEIKNLMDYGPIKEDINMKVLPTGSKESTKVLQIGPKESMKLLPTGSKESMKLLPAGSKESNKLFPAQSKKEDTQKIIDSGFKKENICQRFILATAMIDYYIKEPYVKSCSFYKMSTILNMNPIQRNNYLYEIKKCNKFSDLNNKFREKNECDDFYDIYLNLFNICFQELKKGFKAEFAHVFTEYIMPNFAKTSYFLIKYHLISDNRIDKYFEFLFNTISLFLSLNHSLFHLKDGFNSSVYNILKSILVTLIYISDINVLEKINDSSFIDQILNIFQEDTTTYAFLSTRSEILYKIFLCLINKFGQIETKLNKSKEKKIDNFNYYVEKILEISIGNHSFYLLNIQNLCLLPNSSFNYDIVMNNKDNFIFEISNKIQDVNRKFTSYEGEHLTSIKYNEQIIEIIKDLNEKYLNFLGLKEIIEDISKENPNKFLFVSYVKNLAKKKKDKNNEIKDTKLHHLQNIVKFSNFFGRFQQFTSIFYEIIDHEKLKELRIDNETADLMNVEKHKLLLFLFLMVYKNNENLCLLMNLKAKYFVNFFCDGKQSLFFFIKKIIKIHLQKENLYRLENFNFFFEFIGVFSKQITNEIKNEKKETSWKSMLKGYKSNVRTNFRIEKIEISKKDENDSLKKSDNEDSLKIHSIERNESDNMDSNRKSHNFDSDRKIDEEKIIFSERYDFYYSFNKCLKLFILISKNISIKRIRILDLMQDIIDLTNYLDFKKERILTFMKNDKFHNEIKKKKNTIYQKFLRNYFRFLSEIISKGISFLGFIDEEKVFKNLNKFDISELISDKTIPYKLKIEFVRYILLRKFNFVINLKNSKEIFDSATAQKYIEEDRQTIEFFEIKMITQNNNSHNNQSIKKENIKKQKTLDKRNLHIVDLDKENLFSDIYQILKLLFSDSSIRKIYDDILSDPLIDKIKHKYLLAHYFFEHCLLRPTYQFLNIKYKFQESVDYSKNYRLFHYMYEATNIFRSKILNLYKGSFTKFDNNFIVELDLDIKDEDKKKINDYLKSKFLHYSDSDIIIKYIKLLFKVRFNERDYSFIDSVDDLEAEEENDDINYEKNIKSTNYLDMIELYKNIKNKIKDLVNFDDKIILSKKEKDIYNNNIIYLELENEETFDEELMTKVKDVKESYIKSVKMKIEKNISLIKILDEEQTNLEYGKELLYYFLFKLSDRVSKNSDANSLKFQNFKLKSSTTLIYLNKLFYHHSKYFQDMLEISHKRIEFIRFIIKKLIFPIFNYQISKLDQIESKYVSDNIVYEILLNSIYILKNICEDHNRKNQRYLFWLYFEDEKEDLNPTPTSSITGLVQKNQEKPEVKIVEDPTSNIEKDKNHVNFINYVFKNMRILISKVKDTEDVSTNIFNFVFQMFIPFNNLVIEMLQGTDPQNLEMLFTYPDFEFSSFSDLCMTTQYQFFHLINDIRKIFIKDDLKIYLKKTGNENNKSDFILPETTATIESNFVSNSNDKNNSAYLDDKTRSKISANFLYEHFQLMKNLALIFDIDSGHRIENINLILTAYPAKILLLLATRYLCSICVKYKIPNKYDPLDISAQKKTNSLINLGFLHKFSISNIKAIIKKFSSSTSHKKKNGNSKKKKSKTNDDNNFESEKNEYKELLDKFKKEPDLSEEIYFKIGSEIYLFLTILCDKYELETVRPLIDFKDQKSIIKNKEKEEQKKIVEEKKEQNNIQKSKNSKEKIKKSKTEIYGECMSEYVKIKGKKSLGEDTENLLDQTLFDIDINNYIDSNYEITKFYKQLLRYCEFLVKRFDGDKELKRLYFICHRNYYLASSEDYDQFFETVNRKSPSTKLMAALTFIDKKCLEVKFKNKFIKSKLAKFIFEINHNTIDSINVVFSAANIGILVYSTDKVLSPLLSLSVYLFEYFQIIFNTFIFFALLIYKYRFFVKVNKSNMNLPKKQKISWRTKFDLYFLQSFLFNEKFSYLILNILVCKSVLAKPDAHFLFVIQFISILRNFPTVFEMILLFKEKIFQIICLFVFLIILLYFYTSLAFFNYSSEFVTNISEEDSICNNLISCTLQMIRGGSVSSGGLNSSPSGTITNGFLTRYFIDTMFFVTIVLVLMNSLNGMIITAFSQIREDKKNKEEDIEKKCFICSLDKIEFEKKQIMYDYHLNYEHNFKDYLKFFILYKNTSKKEMNADQSCVIDCINVKNISCFPINKCISLGFKTRAEEGAEKEEDNDSEEDEEEKKKNKKSKGKGKGKAGKGKGSKAKAKAKQKAKPKGKEKAKPKAKPQKKGAGKGGKTAHKAAARKPMAKSGGKMGGKATGGMKLF